MDNEPPSSSKGKNISPPLSITEDHDQPDKKKRKVITDEKKIEKMKKELFSEAKALSEDFGVDVCLVCYDPNQPTAVISVWPEDSQKLKSVIERLKTENPSIPYSEPSFTITDGEAEAEVEDEIELLEDEELQEEEELQEDEEEEELSEDEANRKLEELLKMKEKIEAKLKEKEEEQERRSFITQRNNN